MPQTDPSNLILYTVADRVAWITVNRPDTLNALNRATVAAIAQATERAVTDPDVGVIVVTGAGEKAFVAGADITEMATLESIGAQRFAHDLADSFGRLEASPKPVIAAINGFALGGGCETAMACTIRIASETAKFGQPEVKLGVLPGAGGTQRLPRLVGKGRALQLILTGEIITAQEAYRIGLVNEVVPTFNLIGRAEALLKQIFSNAPIAIRHSLEAVNKGLETSLDEGLALEASFFGLCAGTEDKKEGTAAFLEKRAPQFRGR
jgi:enoyl-CoA hydratase